MKRYKNLLSWLLVVTTIVTGLWLIATTTQVIADPTTEVEPNNDSGTANQMNIGYENYASATIDPIEDEDWFKFTATAGVKYVIDTYNISSSFGNNGLELYLYNSSLNQLDYDTYGASGSGNSDARITFVAGSSDVYYLKIKAYSSTEGGSYYLRILPDYNHGATWDATTFEPNDESSLAYQLNVGRTAGLSSAIEARNGIYRTSNADRDWYRFEAIGGNSYVVDVYNILSSFGSNGLELYLYDNNLNEIAYDTYGASGSGNSDANLTFTAGSSGVYYIRIHPYDSNESGTYSIRILPKYDESGASWNTNDRKYAPNDWWMNAYPIQINPCGISTYIYARDSQYRTTNGDKDWFVFEGAIGEQYSVEIYDVSGFSSGYNVELYVYEQNREEIGHATYNNTSVSFTAGYNGLYYARVHPYNGDDTGNYSVRAVSSTSGTCQNTATPTPNPPVPTATSTPVSTAFPPGSTEINPNNNSGTANQMNIGYENYASATIDPIEDEDWFKFTATAGVKYVIDTYNISSSFGNNGLELYLYNSSLNQLDYDTYGASGSGNSDARITFVAGSSDVYYLKIKAYSSTEGGSYYLRILPDYNHGATWDATTFEPNDESSLAYQLNVGRTAGLSSAIEARNGIYRTSNADRDWYRFEAIGGNSYVVDVYNILSSFGSNGLELYLYDNNLNEIAYDTYGASGSGNSDANLTFTAGSSGVYYIRIHPYDSNESGTYSIRILPKYDESGASWDSSTLEPNSWWMNADRLNILGCDLETAIQTRDAHYRTTNGDKDWFVFEGNISEQYTIETYNPSASFGSYNVELYVYDQNRTELGRATYSDNSVSFIAGYSGLYYVRVHPYNNYDTGTYSVRVSSDVSGVCPGQTGPILQASPANLSFTATEGGSNPAAQAISINNSGTGSLNWTTSDNAAWLSLDSSSGTAPSTVNASVDISGLSAGTYNATITIDGGSAQDSPQDVNVTLTVNSPADAPVLQVSPLSLSFTATEGGNNPAAQAISISNSGTGSLNWTASDNAAWLSLDSSSGTAPSTVNASVDISGLSAGTYNATITIDGGSAQDSPQDVNVTLTVNSPADAPVLQVSPLSLSFTATEGGNNPAAQAISISNSGTGSLNWTASESVAWLSLDSSSGTAPAAVNALVNISGLSAGTYNATITVDGGSAQDSPQTVNVSLVVSPTSNNVNDPMFSQQWGLQKIEIVDAWSYSQGSGNVTIAVIDTGVDYTHVDLGNGKTSTYNDKDYVNNDDDAMDDNGHGTHVAGIIAANTNNGQGIAGVCPQCTILPLKVFDSDGYFGGSASAAIRYAVEQGARIINMSFNDSCTTELADAVNYAYNNNTVLIAATGNACPVKVALGVETYEVAYPARFGRVIAVGASNSNDSRADFSHYGPALDVMVPGVSILSTYLDGGYKYLDGTSMASPMAAGVAGLLLSQNNSLTPAQVQKILENSADDIDESGWDENTGWGRINAAQAMQTTIGTVTSAPEVSCPSESQSDEVRFAEGELVALYTQLRDDVLLSNDTGQEYVNLFYDYGPELVNILVTDSNLRNRTSQFLDNASDAFGSLLPSSIDDIVLDQTLYNEADALVKDIAASGSNDFKNKMLQVWADMSLDEQIGENATDIWEDMQNNIVYLPLIIK